MRLLFSVESNHSSVVCTTHTTRYSSIRASTVKTWQQSSCASQCLCWAHTHTHTPTQISLAKLEHILLIALLHVSVWVSVICSYTSWDQSTKTFGCSSSQCGNLSRNICSSVLAIEICLTERSVFITEYISLCNLLQVESSSLLVFNDDTHLSLSFNQNVIFWWKEKLQIL